MNTGSPNSGPLVTVLICTYNRHHYLPEALRSIFAQTWTHLEIILTRDGGTPVREVIGEFLADPRLIFVDRPENRGKAYSLNRAIERARGTYVCYLDDDDAWYPRHVETLVNALESDRRYGLAYTDLYKAHYRPLADGRRQVLAKNVEISRDFDRMMMLQFNHALHVSVMHRRDLLEKAGGYNEQIKVLIDWDLTRRLCFYTEFLHLPVVTGQYYAAVGESDRISVQQRKSVNNYLYNLLTIRSTRPPKPWPCMPDLAVIVLADQCDQVLEQTLALLFSKSFYPRACYVALPQDQLALFRTAIPEVTVVPVPAGGGSGRQVDAVLARCQADYVAIVQSGLAVGQEEIAFLERSLYPLLTERKDAVAYEIVESAPQCRGVVLAMRDLADARQNKPLPDIFASLTESGIALQKPDFAQYPLQFDHFLTAAAEVQQSGDWDKAAGIYRFLGEGYGNTQWMQTLEANALYQAGRYQKAADLAQGLNETQPTPARLLIEARAWRKLGDAARAAACYRQAEAILEGRIVSALPTENGSMVHPQETAEWIH